MADKNTPYSDIWAAWGEMELHQRKTIGTQMFAFLKGASLAGAVEILENAPLSFKSAAWKSWSDEADLSGYLLGDVVALQETETPTISYGIVRAWLKQADLSRCNEAQIGKMSDMLTTREDKIQLWTRWYCQVDLTMYDLYDFAKLLSRMYPEVAVNMSEAWVNANGTRAVSQLKSLNFNYQLTARLNKLGLPDGVIRQWNKLRGK